jgi:hypothetical protein
MNAQEAILTLNKAVEAFKDEKRRADALLDHAETCKVCRSRIRSLFYTCLTRRAITFEHFMAHTKAEEYRSVLKGLRLEIEIAEFPNAAPTAEWLEELYNFRDDRAG